MEEALIRTALLLGKAGMEKLNAARVAVFGIGGVGGYTAEALVRSGLGALDLIDNDCISESNLNRNINVSFSTPCVSSRAMSSSKRTPLWISARRSG